MYTGSRRAYRGRRGKRRGRFSFVLPAAVIIAITGFAGFFIKDQNAVYSSGSIMDEIYKDFQEREPVHEKAFAAELAVPGEGTGTSSGFLPEAGLIASEEGGELIFGKNVFEKLYPASTTKIMTAIIAIERGGFDEEVQVGNEVIIDEPGASMAGLKPGDTLSMEELLYGLMLPSGNDAANAIAVHIAGSVENFADMMNERAQKLAAVDTHFVNPHGLHSAEHYTTAYDMYLIMHEALKYEKFREISSTPSINVSYTSADGSIVNKNYTNGNRFLSDAAKEPEGAEVFAGKTGTTLAAGSCLVAAAKNAEGGEYIVLALKAESRDSLYDNMTEILEKITQ